MTLGGPGWPTLLGLGGAAAAAVVALYLLRLRRRQVVVPFARLWEQVLGDRRSEAPWRRLQHLVSLLLHLALVALLVLAIGDPRPSARRGGRTVAIVIDASASMRALDGEGGQPRIEEARRRARSIAAGLGPSDLALIVRLDAEPVALGGLASDERELERRIDSISATDGPADLEAALRLCGDALRDHPGPTIILVGDGGWPQAVLARTVARGEALALDSIDLRGIDLRLLRIGRGGDNLAVTGFSVRRYRQNRSAFDALVEIESQRVAPTDVRLEILQDGEPIDVERLSIPAGGKVRRLLPGLSGAGSRLEAKLLTAEGQPLGDALPGDDAALALVPTRDRQRVLLVTDGNLFLEGALLLNENVELTRASPADWEGRAPHDVVVLDGILPSTKQPLAAAIFVDPRGPASPFAVVGEEPAAMVTSVARQHPLMRWVALRDLNLQRASLFSLAPGDLALASTNGRPIIVAREKDGRKALAIGFDLRRSDMPLRVAFPVLLANALEWLAGASEEDAAPCEVGTVLRLPVPEGGVQIRDPDGRVVDLQAIDGIARFHPRRAGLHSLEAAGRRRAIACRPSTGESAIGPREAVVEGRALLPPDSPGRALRREIWAYLLLAALALLLAEWWTYHRRVTV